MPLSPYERAVAQMLLVELLLQTNRYLADLADDFLVIQEAAKQLGLQTTPQLETSFDTIKMLDGSLKKLYEQITVMPS